jgi:hypothetical protein
MRSDTMSGNCTAGDAYLSRKPRRRVAVVELGGGAHRIARGLIGIAVVLWLQRHWHPRSRLSLDGPLGDTLHGAGGAEVQRLSAWISIAESVRLNSLRIEANE